MPGQCVNYIHDLRLNPLHCMRYSCTHGQIEATQLHMQHIDGALALATVHSLLCDRWPVLYKLARWITNPQMIPHARHGGFLRWAISTFVTASSSEMTCRKTEHEKVPVQGCVGEGTNQGRTSLESRCTYIIDYVGMDYLKSHMTWPKPTQTAAAARAVLNGGII